MKTSKVGIDLIKSFEGCKLTAYKALPGEQWFTIGHGHYGPDVKQGMTITQAQADALLVQDLAKFEKSVESTGLKLNQNQFDALVSFTYNCGAGNLKKLVSGRTLDAIGKAILLYNRASGQVLASLSRRRKAESDLFFKGGKTTTTTTPTATPSSDLEAVAQAVIAGKYGTGAVRKNKLEKEGYDYKEIQAIVNKLMKGK